MHINMFHLLLQFQCREWVLFSIVAGDSNDLKNFKFLYIGVQALCCSDFQYINSPVTIFTSDLLLFQLFDDNDSDFL